MRRSDFKYLLLLISILFIPMISCGDDEPVQLSRTDQQLIDSLFFAQKDSLIKLTDSLCDLQYPTILSKAIDSVKNVRREEIEFILGKR